MANKSKISKPVLADFLSRAGSDPESVRVMTKAFKAAEKVFVASREKKRQTLVKRRATIAKKVGRTGSPMAEMEVNLKMELEEKREELKSLEGAIKAGSKEARELEALEAKHRRQYQDLRDKLRVARSKLHRGLVRRGKVAPRRDPYATAGLEMSSGAVEAEDFVPGYGSTPNAAVRARVDSQRSAASKIKAATSNRLDFGPAANSGGRTSVSGKKERGEVYLRDVKVRMVGKSLMPTGNKGIAVSITPEVNDKLFELFSDIPESLRSVFKEVSGKMSKLTEKFSKKDAFQDSDKEKETSRWKKLLDWFKFGGNKEKKEKTESGFGAFLGHLASLGSTFAMVAAALAAKTGIPKIVNRANQAQLKAREWFHSLPFIGNKEKLAAIREQLAQNSEAYEGMGGEFSTGEKIGLGAAGFLARKPIMGVAKAGYRMAGWGMNKMRSVASGALTRAGGARGVGRALGSATRVAGKVATSVTGAAARLTGPVLGKLAARMGTRFLVTQAAGSTVPGIGNIVMGIAATILTIGDIAWTLMSDEMKQKIKDSVSKGWQATKTAMAEYTQGINTRAQEFADSIGAESGWRRDLALAVRTGAGYIPGASVGMEIGQRIMGKPDSPAARTGGGGGGPSSRGGRRRSTSGGSAAHTAPGGMSGGGISPSRPGAQQTQGLLDSIATGESNGRYDIYNNRSAGGGTKDFSNMTVAEVLAWKLQYKAQNGYDPAAGKYQFMEPTLREAAKANGMMGAKFDQATQDLLGNWLIMGKRKKAAAYISGQSNDLDGAMSDLAHEWAAVPLDASGRGAYDGDGLNKGRADMYQPIKQELMRLRAANTGQTASMSPQSGVMNPATGQMESPSYLPSPYNSPPAPVTAPRVSSNGQGGQSGSTTAPKLGGMDYVEDGLLLQLNMGIMA